MRVQAKHEPRVQEVRVEPLPVRPFAPHPGDSSRKCRDHSRSTTAIKKRRRKRVEQVQVRKLTAPAHDPTTATVARSERIRRAEAIAFRRGVQGERAAAKQRRLAKKHAKAQLKASAQAVQRAARRRRASGL